MYSRLDYVLPTALPVPVATVLAHATVDDPAQAALWTGYILTAMDLVERHIGQFLTSRDATWTLSHEQHHNWTGAAYGGYSVYGVFPFTLRAYHWIPMPRSATAISSVVLGLSGEHSITLTQDTDYMIDLSSYFARIRLMPHLQPSSYMQVQFTSGYATPDLIPAPVKHAITLLATRLGYNKGDTDFDIWSPASENLLAPFRVPAFGGISY